MQEASLKKARKEEIKKLEIYAMASVLSEGCASGAGPKGYDALEIKIEFEKSRDILMCKIFTSDKDFTEKAREFQGRVGILHSSEWKILPDALTLGLAPMIFYFPKEGGGQEVLMAYIHYSMLSRLSEYDR
jgi:hypothetical protein